MKEGITDEGLTNARWNNDAIIHEVQKNKDVNKDTIGEHDKYCECGIEPNTRKYVFGIEYWLTILHEAFLLEMLSNILMRGHGHLMTRADR